MSVHNLLRAGEAAATLDYSWGTVYGARGQLFYAAMPYEMILPAGYTNSLAAHIALRPEPRPSFGAMAWDFFENYPEAAAQIQEAQDIFDAELASETKPREGVPEGVITTRGIARVFGYNYGTIQGWRDSGVLTGAVYGVRGLYPVSRVRKLFSWHTPEPPPTPALPEA